MNFLEAKWIGHRLASIAAADLFPLLNVGSSTFEFRTKTQPYIDEFIFAPIRSRGGKVYHLDMKHAEGIDLCGDLLDSGFLDSLKSLNIRSILVSNLLEHVRTRGEICDALTELLPKGGYIFVSGPQAYPYHADPIDTMFRPSVAELHAHFQGTDLLEAAIIDSGNWQQWRTEERGRSLLRTILRLSVPFYRPRDWWALARQAPYIFKHITAFAVVLKK